MYYFPTVYDVDPVGQDDFMGYIDTTLADIIATKSGEFSQKLLNGPQKNRPGEIFISAEELVFCKQEAKFTICASNLSPVFCGLLNPSPSLYIYRFNEGGSLTLIHRSPTVARTTNPTFKPFHLKLSSLCNGDFDRTLKLELVNHRFGAQKPLGYIETTINGLKLNKESKIFQLLDPYSNATSVSSISINDFRIINQASFLDYIKAGCQIHFIVSIDFTASNGAPSDPSSLHYLSMVKNPYEIALEAVGNIIRPYDTTGMYAGFGFGAKLKGARNPPSHLFPLNGIESHPYVNSIEDLLKSYKSKLSEVILSGPTCFAPCISYCNTIADNYSDGNHYFVLLIITDGIISDLNQTKQAIIKASSSPLSIIICGVGDADFTTMNELDSDDIIMTFNGKSAERDIVQFVPMNNFLSFDSNVKRRSPDFWVESQRLLAAEVLAEIPDQLTSYMVSRNLHTELTHVSE